MQKRGLNFSPRFSAPNDKFFKKHFTFKKECAILLLQHKTQYYKLLPVCIFISVKIQAYFRINRVTVILKVLCCNKSLYFSCMALVMHFFTENIGALFATQNK